MSVQSVERNLNSVNIWPAIMAEYIRIRDQTTQRTLSPQEEARKGASDHERRNFPVTIGQTTNSLS